MYTKTAIQPIPAQFPILYVNLVFPATSRRLKFGPVGTPILYGCLSQQAKASWTSAAGGGAHPCGALASRLGRRCHGRAVATTSSALPARLRALQTPRSCSAINSTSSQRSTAPPTNAIQVNRQTETTEADPKPNGTPTQTARQRHTDSHRNRLSPQGNSPPSLPL